LRVIISRTSRFPSLRMGNSKIFAAHKTPSAHINLFKYIN
jgi:hypothetical protein